MDEVERIAELEEQGYFESVRLCDDCGTQFMLKVVYPRRPDARVVTFYYECPYCGHWLVEYDSD